MGSYRRTLSNKTGLNGIGQWKCAPSSTRLAAGCAAEGSIISYRTGERIGQSAASDYAIREKRDHRRPGPLWQNKNRQPGVVERRTPVGLRPGRLSGDIRLRQLSCSGGSRASAAQAQGHQRHLRARAKGRSSRGTARLRSCHRRPQAPGKAAQHSRTHACLFAEREGLCSVWFSRAGRGDHRGRQD